MASNNLPWEISPQEVCTARAAAEPIVIIDVRTPDELTLSALDGAEHIPMDQVPGQLPSIEAMADKARLIIMCHHGVRSMNVTAWLREKGVANCQSMAGGIDLWSVTVDHKVPRY